MIGSRRVLGYVALATIVVLAGGTAVKADPFTASYADGGTWDTIFGQGFNVFVNDGLAPGDDRTFGDTANLTRWEFFKSGEADTASNIKLAIISAVAAGQTGIYADLTNLNANDPNGPVVGMSTNTIASTASIATGAPIRFNFDNLELAFGDLYYGAVLVNQDESGNLTPVLVSALTADYLESDPNVFIPETNYDFSADPNGRVVDPITNADFFTSATNFMHTDEFGTFFDGFTAGGDANFIAYFDTTFPPDPIPGDFNNSNNVDAADLLQWNGDYGVNGDSDADGDGDSDGMDFLIWQQHDGEPFMAISAVPEPASAVLACALGLGGILTRYSRRRPA